MDSRFFVDFTYNSGLNSRLDFFLLQLGITDSGVIDGLQFLYEHRLAVLDVTEGDGALAEVAFADLRVDDACHEVTNGLLGIVGQ